MVHSTVLIQLRDPASRTLAYDPPPPGYSGPKDDIIVFAHSVQHHGLSMHIDNRDFYGFLLSPLDDESTLDYERSQFLHLKLESVGNTPDYIHPFIVYCSHKKLQLDMQTIKLFNMIIKEMCYLPPHKLMRGMLHGFLQFLQHTAKLVLQAAVYATACPSVCLSVTLQYYVKMRESRGMRSSPSGSPVYLCVDVC